MLYHELFSSAEAFTINNSSDRPYSLLYVWESTYTASIGERYPCLSPGRIWHKVFFIGGGGIHAQAKALALLVNAGRRIARSNVNYASLSQVSAGIGLIQNFELKILRSTSVPGQVVLSNVRLLSLSLVLSTTYNSQYFKRYVSEPYVIHAFELKDNILSKRVSRNL